MLNIFYYILEFRNIPNISLNTIMLKILESPNSLSLIDYYIYIYYMISDMITIINKSLYIDLMKRVKKIRMHTLTDERLSPLKFPSI